jgi:hypothetical protein
VDTESWSHGKELEEGLNPAKPFLAFWDLGVRKTRSLGELTCRSPKTPKRERSVISASCHSLRSPYKKGPVDLFKGFQQESKELFRLRRRMIQRLGGRRTSTGFCNLSVSGLFFF